jgi:DNA-binding transcriptional MerR regulator
MSRKNNLFSIGEMSKITDVSIKSLRYYEEKKLLKPAYIAPDSGYRYYTFNQAHLIVLIKFAIEMEIPLKEFAKFFSEESNTINLEMFRDHAKVAAEEKIKALQRGLKYINFFEKQVALHGNYKIGEIYVREFPEKFFYVRPFDYPFCDANYSEVAKLFFEATYYEDDESEPEYGFLIEFSPGGTKRFLFAEATKDTTNYKPIPAGKYYCTKNDFFDIERARENFPDYLKGKDSFIAIETEAFTDKIILDKPISELRVLALN